MTFPSGCHQYFLGSWWASSTERQVHRGRLIWAYLPHVDQQALELCPQARGAPTEHGTATAELRPLRPDRPPPESGLPVAGLPQYPGETYVALRAKRRPALVISTGGASVPESLRRGGARYQTAPTLLVAPYFGADRDGTRAGWDPVLVDRIRRCEYPQYVWDQLPLGGSAVSILRLDHIQPLGNLHSSYELTDWRLTPDALSVIDEWVDWLVSGADVPLEGVLDDLRKLLMD